MSVVDEEVAKDILKHVESHEVSTENTSDMSDSALDEAAEQSSETGRKSRANPGPFSNASRSVSPTASTHRAPPHGCSLFSACPSLHAECLPPY